VLKRNWSEMVWRRFLRRAIAIVASGLVASPAAYANRRNDVILVPSADLPVMARQNGEAMFLHESRDGRALLYIEQNEGAALAILDVTDPVHIRAGGVVQLGQTEPFDFVSSLGKEEELIRFRQSHEDAILNLHKVRISAIGDVQLPKLKGPTDDRCDLTEQAPPMQSAPDRETGDISRAVDWKQVREEVTNCATGTTFLLTDKGVLVIRRPAVEWEKKKRDERWFWEHTGG
jgi:hypothetical protein